MIWPWQGIDPACRLQKFCRELDQQHFLASRKCITQLHILYSSRFVVLTLALAYIKSLVTANSLWARLHPVGNSMCVPWVADPNVFCAGKPAGKLFADTASGCAFFFNCAGASSARQACGAGTLFDESCSCCNLADVVRLVRSFLCFLSKKLVNVGLGQSGRCGMACSSDALLEIWRFGTLNPNF